MSSADRFRQLTCTQGIRADLPARSIRAAAVTAASGFSDFALRIGSTAVLARLILPEHFGLVMMAMAVTAIADQLRDLGLSSATVQQAEITHAEVSNLFWINVGIGALLAALVCATAPLVAAYYHEPRLIGIVCTLSFTLICGGLTVQHQALLTRQLKLGHTSAIRLASSVLSTALAIGLAIAGFGFWALLWREIVRAALLAIGMWLCFPWTPSFPDRRTNVRTSLRFGANLTAANILATLTAGFDRFLLGRFWGAEPVAVYRQAYQLISAPTEQLLSPLYQVAQPCLSMLQSEADRYRRFYAKVVTIVCVITMPLSLFTAVYAREITQLLLGPRWGASAPILALLSLGTFVKQASGSTVFVPITRGHGHVYFRLTVLQNAVLVALMAVGVHWGGLGIAAADVIATYLLIGPRLYYSFKGSPVTSLAFFGASFRPAIASLAMATLLFVARPHLSLGKPLESLIAGGIAAGMFFGATLILLPGGRAECATLAADAQRAFRRQATTRAPDPAPLVS